MANKLRSCRTAALLSLDQLATRAHVSKGTLVNLEQGQGNPSIAVLCQVAAALGISLADLLDDPSNHVPSKFRTGTGRLVWKGRKGGWAKLTIGATGPDMIELWEWELRPGERYEARAHSPGTRELLLPSRGKLGVSVGAWSGVVHRRQGLLAATDVAHAYWCEGVKPVRFRMFVSERPGR